MNAEIHLPSETVLNKIYDVRGMRVMLDRDFAELYQVETKQLKRQVRRNIERFPEDFMFELTKEEVEILRSQIGTSSHGGTRYTPMAYTEQGIAMLSSVLTSKTAIHVNIQIVRVFTQVREMVLTHKDLLMEMEEVRKRVSGQDEKIQVIFDYLTKFIQQENTPREKVGFRQSGE